MDKLCPCLAHLLTPEKHGSAEIEGVALVGSASPPPPERGTFPESATSWLSSIKTQAATAVLGAPDELEPHWKLLCTGATMRLDGPTGEHVKASAALRDEPVSLSLAPDKTLLTWKSCRQANSMAVASGALAVSTLTVEGAAKGWFSAPDETEFVLVADDQRLTLRAESAAQKDAWATALKAVAVRAVEDRQGRKLGYETRRSYEMNAKRREAEARKAEIMQGCNTGMRHTARAMASR